VRIHVSSSSSSSSSSSRFYMACMHTACLSGMQWQRLC
jgi:hypothetical protein